MNKCVYIHKIKGVPIYVGSGTSGQRPYNRSGRSVEHAACFDDSDFEIDIIKEGLTECDAKVLEKELIDKLMSDGILLLNKAASTCRVIKIDRTLISSQVYYSEDSPTYLRWRVEKRSGRNGCTITAREGDVAGYAPKTKNSYCSVHIKGVLYLAHRVVWVLHHGEIPDGLIIDHIDGNKTNNSISNLRCVTCQINSKNKSHKQSNTGFQAISKKAPDLKRKNSGAYSVSWSEGLYNSKIKTFIYGPKSLDEQTAFDMAMAFRNELVALGKIELTGR